KSHFLKIRTGKKSSNWTESHASKTMAKNKIGIRQLRSFGLIVGTGFAVIALWPVVFRGQSLRIWALSVSGLLLVTGLVFPPVLRPLYRVWMTLGEGLGWVNSRILLSVVYYTLLVPIGMVRRFAGSDPMRRKFEPTVATYKIPRNRRPA